MKLYKLLQAFFSAGAAQPPLDPDPLWASVALFLPLTTDLTAVKGGTFSAVGDAAVSGGYLQLDGTGDAVVNTTTAFCDVPTGCMEVFFTPASIPGSGIVPIWSLDHSGGGQRCSLGLSSDGNYWAKINNSWGSTGVAAQVGREDHIALVGGNIGGSWARRVAIGGIWTSYYSDASFYNDATGIVFGREYIGLGSGLHAHGKIRFPRLTKGVTRYTYGTNFTAPTPPLPGF